MAVHGSEFLTSVTILADDSNSIPTIGLHSMDNSDFFTLGLQTRPLLNVQFEMGPDWRFLIATFSGSQIPNVFQFFFDGLLGTLNFPEPMGPFKGYVLGPHYGEFGVSVALLGYVANEVTSELP